ncbi:MAG: Ig-like domain-containing protein [Sandaracinaceae bacterium]
MRVVAAAFGIITSLVACDVPPDLIPEDGPVVLGAAPADGEGDADRAGPFRVFFDRRLFPRDVNRGRVSLESGTRGSFLALRFDPVDRVLLVSPQAQLDPATRYRLTLEGLRDLEGRAMASRTVITFETGEDAVWEPPPEAPTWADVAPLFAGCASEGCHVGPAPALGLDLSSGEAVARTAIGVPAVQTRVGARDRVWYGASSLDGLARIDVVAGQGQPARSYLLYKALGDPHAAGERMPPSPDPALDARSLRRLADWILAGAPTG